MDFAGEPLPELRDDLVLPAILGVADLTTFAYQGGAFVDLVARVDGFHAQDGFRHGGAGRLYDMAVVHQLGFCRGEGLNVQDDALDRSQMFRLARLAPVRRSAHPLRVLALAVPGDLMANAPLDFLTNHLDVRLDLLHLLPDRPLPAAVPDHDVAFCAVGEADPALLARLAALLARWKRPVLNDPRFLPMLARDTLSRALAEIPGLCSPRAVAVERGALDALAAGRRPPEFPGPGGPFPCLIRPANSHAGASLERVTSPAELAEYLRFSTRRDFFVTAFEDYRSDDGLYRKSRIAFIDRRPFLCHMAVSDRWMVHYLNAGMTDSAAKRAEEAQAMATFDTGFARRHAAAFAALHERLGFDYYSIDCAETRDGRLLVFEADVAAIVHLMDPPDLFPYKPPQMRRVFDAFGALLRRAAARAPRPAAQAA